jgi:hypothetical protein
MNGECATDGDCLNAIPIILKLQLAMTNIKRVIMTIYMDRSGGKSI